ncbi:MAG: hypothetical protein ACOYO1_02985 [Bacteroidales bacterium]
MSTISTSLLILESLLGKKRNLLADAPRETAVTSTYSSLRISFKVIGTAASAVAAK